MTTERPAPGLSVSSGTGDAESPRMSIPLRDEPAGDTRTKRGRDGAPLRIAVVGAGIAGIAAAWELRRIHGDAATILLVEAYGRVGGKLKTVDFDTGPVDMGAEAFLAYRRDFVDLIEAVGCRDELVEPSRSAKSSVYVRGQLVDVPASTIMGIPATGADVASILPPQECDRIDAERSGAPMTWSPGQDTSVGQLVEARYGRAVVDALVSPLLGGVYSCSADGLGVRATLPQLATAMDKAHAESEGRGIYLSDVVGGLLSARENAPRPSGPVFRALRGGFGHLIEGMVAQANPELLLNTAVESLGSSEQEWYLEPVGYVDQLVLAVPAPVASVLLQDVAPAAAEALDGIELSSSVVVGMRFASDRGIPERSGVLMGADAPTEAKAFTFSSRKWPHLAERGGSFVRASYGTFEQPWYVEMSDRALLRFALDDVETLTGERKKPEEYFVQRWYGGLPRYGVGYTEAMKAICAEVERIPGLALAGAMVDGVGVPASAASGIAAARSVAGKL